MIITCIPVRVSFLGGGSDYPVYFRQHDGATAVTTIAKDTYVAIMWRCARCVHALAIPEDNIA